MPNPNGGLDYANCVNQNPPNSVTFSHPLLPNLIHRFFFSITVLLCLPGTLYAAGYSCPAYKKYTSCNSGYYLNGTSAGNSCDACPAGCTCAGGTDAPSCGITCPAGQFLWWWGDGTQCENCHGGYYCPGGINMNGSGSVNGANSAGVVPIYECPVGHYCPYASSVPVPCPAGEYQDSTQASSCKTCDVGTYSTGGATSCTACTNKPDHSHYVGTGSTDLNCIWECDAGYRSVNGNTCVQICTAGITQLHLGTGVTIPLFATKTTEHALHVGYNNAVCYGNLNNGAAAGALNINYGGQTYHAIGW